MLPKEREALVLTHAVGASVRIGNRSATLIRHYHEWESAQVLAGYIARTQRLRCIVCWCPFHKQWMVWRTNVTARVKTRGQVMYCSQCGLNYDDPACGPTHALQWHRLLLSGVKKTSVWV